MGALQNEGTVSLSLFRYTNKASAINFVKSSQTVLVEMTQTISTHPGMSWFGGETGKTSAPWEITLKYVLICWFCFFCLRS